MTHDPEGAIRVLKDGLKPERTHSFAQADMMVRRPSFFPLQLVTRSNCSCIALFRVGVDAPCAEAVPGSCGCVFEDDRAE